MPQTELQTDQDWMLRELGTGLKKLLCLRLEGQPADDSIAGTLLGWYEALSSRWYDEIEDTPRFRAAFRELMRLSKRWPAPADFLDALPPLSAEYKPRADYAPRLCSDESNRIGMSHITAILDSLGGPIAAKHEADTHA